MAKKLVPAGVLALAAGLALAPSSRADEGPAKDTIVVTTRGRATQIADAVEVEVVVAAQAEDPEDAEKKYRDKLAKVIAALKGEDGATPKKKRPKATPAPKKPSDDDEKEETKEPKKEEPAKEKEDESKVPVEIREEGLQMGSPNEPDPRVGVIRRVPQPQPQAPEPLRFSSRVIAKIAHPGSHDRAALRKRVVWLYQKALDVDALPTVRFVCETREAIKRRAYADAMEKAKANAAELAKLAGVNLGPISSVREGLAPLGTAEAAGQGASQALLNLMLAERYGIQPGAATPFDVAVDVDLTVQFSITR